MYRKAGVGVINQKAVIYNEEVKLKVRLKDCTKLG